MEPHLPTTPFGRRTLSLASCCKPVGRESLPAGKGRSQVERFQGYLRRQGKARRLGSGADGSQRAAQLSSRNRPERGRTGRVPVEPAVGGQGEWNGALDAEEAPGGPGRRRPHPAQRLPQRQALRAQNQGRGDRGGVRLRSHPYGGEGGANTRRWPKRCGRTSARRRGCGSGSRFVGGTSRK